MTAMKVLVVLMVLCLALVSARKYSTGYYEEEYSPAYYDFGYAVKDPYTDTDYGHRESRDGDVTRGSYSVLLPDGRIQVVTYYVDPYSGFVADVKYIGVARHDVYQPVQKAVQRPVYSRASYRPVY